MPEVIMPKMGDTMEYGTLLKWLKCERDDVSETTIYASLPMRRKSRNPSRRTITAASKSLDLSEIMET